MRGQRGRRSGVGVPEGADEKSAVGEGVLDNRHVSSWWAVGGVVVAARRGEVVSVTCGGRLAAFGRE